LDARETRPYAAWPWADAVADPGEGVAADGTIQTGAGIVAAVVERFADLIGLWADDQQDP
jgi:hypothetical protein